MRLDDLEPRHIYKYADTRVNKQGQKSPTTGVHEIRVFKHAFTKAVEWGLISRHPFKGEVRLKGTKPRSRYVEDWEIIEALSLVPKRKSGSVLMLQAYIRVKMLIGIRRGDMLRLRMSDITDVGITVRPHKTANSTGLVRTFEWTSGTTDRSRHGTRRAPDRHRAVAILHETRRGLLRRGDGSGNLVGLDVATIHVEVARRDEDHSALH